MQRALINWRPLGQLFVDAGLISADELEEALAEQSATGERLGEILVSHGLVSAPDLTRALVDQLGRELEGERPNGSSARRVIAGNKQSAAAATPLPDPLPSPQTALESPIAQTPPPAPEPAPPQAPPAPTVLPPAPAVEPSPSVPAPVPSPVAAAETDDEPHLLLVQLDALRDRLTREFAVRESALSEKLTLLQSSLATLEASLAAERAAHHQGMETLEKSLHAERAAHRRTLDELERGRSEARRQATELSECVGRIRTELAQIDAELENDLRALRPDGIASPRQSDPAALPTPTPANGAHLMLTPNADGGLDLRPSDGPPPAVENEIEIDGRRFRVVSHRRSPLGLDDRVCVHVQPS